MGCSVCGFIWKNAIASNSIATHIRMTPMKIIVRNAPMSRIREAVENNLTVDFVERDFSDFLAKNAQIMMKIQKTTNATIAPVIREKTVLLDIADVSGVFP
jgi:hypothetical protein